MTPSAVNLAHLITQVNFAPFFVAAPGNATVEAVADHVDHIAQVAGKEQYAICIF